MSLDIWLEHPKCPHCGQSMGATESLNYTYNCAPMWRGAGWQHEEWDHRLAGEMAPVLRAAIHAMVRERAKYEMMNPPNGWGSCAGCLAFLGKLYAQCVKHPNATVEMWR